MIECDPEDRRLSVSSNECHHLDNLASLLGVEVEAFSVENMWGKTLYYYYVVTPTDEDAPPPATIPRTVRKFARDVIRGMMDARPVFGWSADGIDLDLPKYHAGYVTEYMPYMNVQHLDNGRVRLYTTGSIDTQKALTYLYRDVTAAKPSRKRIYDGIQVGAGR